MDPKTELATLNLSGILMHRVQEQLVAILKSMQSDVAKHIAAEDFVALQSGIVSGTAEDLGIVRYSALFRECMVTNPQWPKLSAEDQKIFKRMTHQNYELHLNIFFPTQGTVRAHCNVAKDGSFDLGSVMIKYEGSLGTLWFNDMMAAIKTVGGISPLGAPQHVEKKQ